MNIVIVGCGMVGSQLAAELDRIGNDISVVDRDESSFDALPAEFSGFTTTGIAIDTEVLRNAGIETCEAICAVTGDDNTNIMVSEIASKVFGIKRVFARVRDIGKGEIFENLGINTVCPTRLVVNAAREALEAEPSAIYDMNIDGHSVKFTTMEMPEQLVGCTVSDIIYEPKEVLFAVVRGGVMMFPQRDNIVFDENDLLIFAKEA